MRFSWVGKLRRAVVMCGVALLVMPMPNLIAAEEPASQSVLDWETRAGRSYFWPAVEVGGFTFGLNQFNRHFGENKDTYDTDWDTFWDNVNTPPEFDRDPFSVNQIGHPYQGSMYYGFARSAGLNYWESLLYSLGGSYLWETYGETDPPSINDLVTTPIGGSFLGEALFRMSSLLLEGGGGKPGFWRELGAAAISPPTGFNRLAFGDRFDAIFPSRDPAVFVRLRAGATLTTRVRNEDLPDDVREQDGSADFSMTYGLPGKPGYRYTRPFDYFHFEFTAVPNASEAADAIENLTVRGLLAGTSYEVGDDYRGLWGLFGGYEYLSPQIFRVATTNLLVGTAAQWWLSRTVALQGTALGGAGFGAAGTVADRDERDYRYGVIPEAVLGLRLIVNELAMLEASGRQYWVVGVGSDAASRNADQFGQEVINRASVGVTVRLFGPHALGLHYVISSRETGFAGGPDRHQSVQTVTLSYNFLGQTRFGAVEWRPAELSGR